ncbi:MAG TPA: peroxiredoxin [Blastocatellia bacterium]|nr:peroxiredoxin [Blastocatellia bacterium]
METVGPQIGQLAPEIDLPDGQGKRWQLSNQRGKTVVLIFYPGDETPVCTKQLCSVRDNWARYRAAGAEVVGINTDSIEKHRRFAENHELPLRLLSDTKGDTVRAYDMKAFFGTKRGVVVIDKDGYIRYRKVVLPVFRPGDDEILEAINKISAQE